ncbi:MAG: glutathione S-transferase N-terminal domain-containing protein, partial [Xanthobacteraceae bacterium]
MKRARKPSNKPSRKIAGPGRRPEKLIELFYWPTPNGWKISIMLEECGLPFAVHPIDISKGDQFSPHFLAISPNNRIPAIVDPA